MPCKRDPFPLPAAEASLRLADVDRGIGILLQQTDGIRNLLKDTPQAESVHVSALPHPFLRPRIPISVTLLSGGSRSTPLWSARVLELRLESRGRSRERAIERLLRALVDLYLDLEHRGNPASERWLLLQQLVEKCPPRDDEAPASLVVQPSPAPTLTEWIASNIPDRRKRAWRDGAHARFKNDDACDYRFESSLRDWRAGYSAMAQYLSAGGRIRCHYCGLLYPSEPS